MVTDLSIRRLAWLAAAAAVAAGYCVLPPRHRSRPRLLCRCLTSCTTTGGRCWRHTLPGPGQVITGRITQPATIATVRPSSIARTNCSAGCWRKSRRVSAVAETAAAKERRTAAITGVCNSSDQPVAVRAAAAAAFTTDAYDTRV